MLNHPLEKIVFGVILFLFLLMMLSLLIFSRRPPDGYGSVVATSTAGNSALSDESIHRDPIRNLPGVQMQYIH